ncbi:cobalamin biosynthesis protein CobD [Aureimonas fodinaquatilis]|uniref:Cobalamin biosynthesis protein CobD n=1 Tax=Aureimonas fodinaquatilis TaxID=2565783 RepID=A0A5B0DRX8_9HYPH|nr:adenosylcobinamide-phosphate synthase CbiB [Aureimonas fodinaquatilis]KAA0969557.1 cobalamin biosynthesis protein CobD [Aureimonas fodinaquatilis]
MMFALSLLVAMLVDALLGWPNRLFAAIGHPVTWLGRVVTLADKHMNHARHGHWRRLAGLVATIAIVGASAAAGFLLQELLPGGWAGVLLLGILAWPLVALRSLYEHVAAVWRPLAVDDLGAARGTVAMIVGRDPSGLDQAGIARAALESLAENTSDGIVAPVFWGVLLGLPGIAAYKAINTLDSMIGHRTPRHEQFGWAAARLDDLVNLIPARLTGLLFAAMSRRPGTSLSVMWRDAPGHRSPNAGWPEAAMAGALNVRLSGPRVYASHRVDEPWINEKAPDPDAADLAAGLALFVRAMILFSAILAVIAILIR